MSHEKVTNRSWTLIRYAVEINHHSPFSSPNSASSSSANRSQHQTIDCSDGFLSLHLTTTQQLQVIRDQTEKLECVDLLTSNSSTIFATYTGDSLLVTYLVPNDSVQRKFLIKFASTAIQNGHQHCQECVTVLSRSISISHFDSISSKSIVNTSEKFDSIVSMTEMIQALIGTNPIHLSSYYHQKSTFDLNTTKELLAKYLCDETFPDFVASVSSMLDTLKGI